MWDEWERQEPSGGFDAVIGNPPWDRMKLQDVEWFAARVPQIAHATRAADRKRMIDKLRKAKAPMAAAYDEAAATAEAAANVAAGISPFGTAKERREWPARDYPLLSGNDVNVYSLFVERAARLVSRQGIVGLLVPSGIAADQGYNGPPFAWDEEDRLRRRARLDALFFLLYGLDRDAADYVLGTFPIVQREEHARYNGRFRSRDLILNTMAALAAGQPDADVAG